MISFNLTLLKIINKVHINKLCILYMFIIINYDYDFLNYYFII
uniref:Uncharacterized protein n=1 Tax=viral metagenome TaxID=1070528 RepID=A0A6C0H8A0_9ZZZZ